MFMAPSQVAAPGASLEQFLAERVYAIFVALIHALSISSGSLAAKREPERVIWDEARSPGAAVGL
jgi:hypothetical protein